MSTLENAKKDRIRGLTAEFIREINSGFTHNQRLYGCSDSDQNFYGNAITLNFARGWDLTPNYPVACLADGDDEWG